MPALPGLRSANGSGTETSTTPTPCDLPALRHLVEEQRKEIEVLKRMLEVQEKENKSLQRQILTKKPPFPCPLTTCDISFSRPDNLSRHIKRESDSPHQHLALIMKERYCLLCQRVMSRQCDFWRHVRSKHPDTDLLSWELQKAIPS